MKKIILLILSLFAIVCNTHEYSLENDLKSFDEKFVNHFPNQNNLKLKSYHYSYPQDSLVTNFGAFLTAEYTISGSADSLINTYLDESIKICHHNDSCNIILPVVYFSNHTIENPILLPCDTEYIPVPNFRDNLYDIDTTANFLPNDFTIYILEAKPGKYIRDGLLYKNNIMPASWEHGYTKGVAISKERMLAIYWIYIW